MIYLILLVFLSYFHGKSALCPPSSIAVPSQNLCVALLKKNLTFCEAETHCKRIGGHLFQPKNKQSIDDVRKALIATVEGKNINVAWVGIISNPVTGKDLFLNGTDATNDLPLPLFWVNTKNATAYSDAWESCWFSLPNSTDCENIVKQTKCYVKPIQKYSTNPRADHDLFLQFIKIQLNMTPMWKNDPSCVQLVNRTFFKGYKPKFDKNEPSIALIMNVNSGVENPDLYLTLTSHKFPAVCQINSK